MTAVEAVYEELRSVAPVQPGITYRSFAAPAHLHIQAFVDGTNRLPGVLFRFPRRRAPAGLRLPHMRGAELVVTSEGTGRTAIVNFRLSAASSEYSAVFVELASRMIAEASAETTVESAIARVLSRILAWARFFDVRKAGALSRTRQLGLIGELLCLERICDILDESRAVDSWTGPSGSAHDFQNRHGAIEAKLTTTAAPERIRITSERQLDDTTVPVLLVYAVLAQEVASGSLSVPDLVQSVRERIASSAPTVLPSLEDRLVAAGYADADKHLLTVRVAVRDECFLRIAAGFPRIRPIDLIPGVSRVSYDLTWSAIAPFRITSSQARSAFSGEEQ